MIFVSNNAILFEWFYIIHNQFMNARNTIFTPKIAIEINVYYQTISVNSYTLIGVSLTYIIYFRFNILLFI